MTATSGHLSVDRWFNRRTHNPPPGEDVAAVGSERIVCAMPSRRTEPPASDDLFSAAAKKSRPAEIAAPNTTNSPNDLASSPRYLLPKDLSGALARLDDREIDSLLAAVIDEVTRRGRLAPSLKAKLLELTQSADRAPKPQPLGGATTRRHQETDGEGAHSLTVGQTNAVRAAFMAAVKPSVIARQFGISQAAVKKALSSEARSRKA
jgi:hypothetical protein